MKTTKKLTAVLLALLMLLSVFTLAASALSSTPAQAAVDTSDPSGYDPMSGESETSYVLRQVKLFIQNIIDTIRGFVQKLLPDFLADLLDKPVAEDTAAKA